MSTRAITSEQFEPPRFPARQVLYGMAVLLATALGPFLIWPVLAKRLLVSSFLPHLYCYLGKTGLVWTHVAADSLIGLSYFAISGTLVYLVQKGRRDIPFHWMFLAFGSFIVACGGTHFMEVVTVWVPVYVLSASLKVVTALVSLMTAVILPFTVPQILALIQSAKASEAAEDRVRGLLEAAPDAMVVVDQAGKIVLVNSQTERLFGYQRQELLGREIEMLVPERFRSQYRSQRAGFSHESGIQPIKAGLELCGLPKQGHEFPVEISLSPLETGQGVLVSSAIRDIGQRKRAEEALREREEKFHQIADNIQEIFWMVDATSMRAIYVNPAFEQITGRTCASLQAEPLSYREIIHADDRDRVLGSLNDAQGSGEFDETFRITRPDGSIRWVAAQGFPVRDASGNIYRLAGVVQDITERKHAEEARRESEDRYRDLVEHSQDLLCTHDLSGNLLSCNPAPARILGYEVAELLTIPMRKLVAPEFREQFDGYLSRIKAAGTDKGAMAVITRSGERRIWEYNNTLRTEGVPSPIVRGMAHDVTERKRAEKSLQLFRLLIDQSNDAIEVVDPETLRFIDINGRACLDLGYTREELLSMGVYDIDPNINESVYSRVNQELRDSGSSILESLHRRKNGSTYPVEVSIKQVQLDRKYMVSVARDITERKRAELALQESQATLARLTRIAALGELTASIAHEINQPLAAVATNAGAALHWLVVQPPNLEEAREAASRAIQEANRASGVIKRVRALLKKAPPQLQPLNGNEVIQEVVLLAESELLRGGVTVKTELAADIPNVLGDRAQLQQVILNLILNAIDAMSMITDQLRELFIRAAKHPDGVLIQVQDSGSGIDPAHADRIFEPFFTTKPQGIGLGLSISRTIIETHGGRLWAESGSRGALFQFVLPAFSEVS